MFMNIPNISRFAPCHDDSEFFRELNMAMERVTGAVPAPFFQLAVEFVRIKLPPPTLKRNHILHFWNLEFGKTDIRSCFEFDPTTSLVPVSVSVYPVESETLLDHDNFHFQTTAVTLLFQWSLVHIMQCEVIPSYALFVYKLHSYGSTTILLDSHASCKVITKKKSTKYRSTINLNILILRVVKDWSNMKQLCGELQLSSLKSKSRSTSRGFFGNCLGLVPVAATFQWAKQWMAGKNNPKETWWSYDDTIPGWWARATPSWKIYGPSIGMIIATQYMGKYKMATKPPTSYTVLGS